MIKDSMEVGGKRSQLRASRMAEVLRRHGHPTDASQMRLAYGQGVAKLEQEVWSKYLDVGTREQLFVILSQFDPGLASSAEDSLWFELEEAYTTPIFDLPPALAPGADWALGTTQLEGYRIGMICNTGVTPGRDMRKLLDDYGILQYFEAVMFSDEERIRKPSPEIFHRALALLGVSPGQAVHVGDDAISDISGAKGAGMRAIMVRASLPHRPPVPPDQLVSDLFGVPEAIASL